MTGPVAKEYKSGDRYIGGFLNGKRQGTGTYYWKDGSSYVGDWVNDQRNGFGTFIASSGRKRSGQWQNGQFTQAAPANADHVDVQQGPQKATINWMNPVAASIQVNDSKMEVSLCIQSDSKVEEVEFYVNGEVQQGSRGFKIVPSDACNFTLRREISLKPGKNQLQVYVSNAAGRSASTSKSIQANFSNNLRQMKRELRLLSEMAVIIMVPEKFRSMMQNLWPKASNLWALM